MDAFEDAFVDPVSFELVENAYVTPFGHSFSEATLKMWLKDNHTCPLTQRPLTFAQCAPNYTVREAVRVWRREKRRLAKAAPEEAADDFLNKMQRAKQELADARAMRLVVETQIQHALTDTSVAAREKERDSLLTQIDANRARLETLDVIERERHGAPKRTPTELLVEQQTLEQERTSLGTRMRQHDAKVRHSTSRKFNGFIRQLTQGSEHPRWYREALVRCSEISERELGLANAKRLNDEWEDKVAREHFPDVYTAPTPPLSSSWGPFSLSSSSSSSSGSSSALPSSPSSTPSSRPLARVRAELRHAHESLVFRLRSLAEPPSDKSPDITQLRKTAAQLDDEIEAQQASLERLVERIRATLEIVTQDDTDRVAERAERQFKAIVLKERANAHFRAKRYVAARTGYEAAIEVLAPYFDPLLHLNRAAAFSAIENFEQAIADCDIVISRNPKDEVLCKALRRKAYACIQTRDFPHALSCVVRALEIDETDENAKDLMKHIDARLAL